MSGIWYQEQRESCFRSLSAKKTGEQASLLLQSRMLPKKEKKRTGRRSPAGITGLTELITGFGLKNSGEIIILGCTQTRT